MPAALATGDSMIQTVDGYLSRGLAAHRGTSVRSDAHIGSGVSKPDELDWVRKARGQAADLKPDVTVMFLGADDGSPLPVAGRRAAGARRAAAPPGWRPTRRASRR